MPANSTPMYPPPTTANRFGSRSRKNASFELIACSIPGMAGNSGQLPTATRTWSAVTLWRTVPAGFDLHRMRIKQPGASLEQLDAGAVQQAPVDPVEPLDFPVLVRDELAPIESGLVGRPAESGGLPVVVGEPRSANQELLRHAADR